MRKFLSASIFVFILIIVGVIYYGRRMQSANELHENISHSSLTESIEKDLHFEYGLKPKALNDSVMVFVFPDNSNILDAKKLVSKIASKYKLEVVEDWETNNYDGYMITGVIYTFKDEQNYFHLAFVYIEDENALRFWIIG